MLVRRTALALAPIAVLTALVGAAPAQAQSRTAYDARHDVVGDREGRETITTPRPGRREGDVVEVRTTYAGSALVVVQDYVRLTRPRSGDMSAHFVSVRTNEGLRADLTVYVDGRTRDWQGERSWEVAGRDSARCAGLRTRIDYTADTVRVRIPRSCLSDPRWVRVGSAGSSLQRGYLYADDARLRGRLDQDDLAFGPRLRRG